MKITLALFFCFLSISTKIIADQVKAHDIAPSVLQHTARQMRTAGFWIGQHPAPSKVILSPKDIATFNQHIQDDLKLTRDIFALTQHFKTDALLNEFNKALNEFVQKDLFTKDGLRNGHTLLDKARLNMNAAGIVLGVAPRYGLVVHYADVRFLPIDEPLYESAGDVDFDQLQNSSYDVGTPVAVVHVSADKQWYYVFSAIAQGWVRADDVAIGDVKKISDYAQSQDFVVATVPKADIFLNQQKTMFHDYVRMGARLPLVGKDQDSFVVRVPVFDSENKLMIVDGYVRAGHFHQGYLAYTAENILSQAFAMLNQPYGWGGMYGEQDCSAFLDEVFGTVGIILPRDSKDQALVGQELSLFKPTLKDIDRVKAFDGVLAGSTVLTMKGHIMLYVGSVNKKPYAIHAVWAYRTRVNDKDVPKVINKITVSDLNLGEGSTKGSLLKRLTKIIAIQ